MGKKRSSSQQLMPRLATGGSGSAAGSRGASSSSAASSSYLRVQPGSGAITLASHVAPVAPPPTQLLSHAAASSSQGAGGRKGKSERADTAGAGWGHMRAPTLTPELKRELLIVKMRGALDPKRFYRSADGGKSLPKHFQMGTMVEGAEDGAHNRLTKRERKGSMLQELMSDGTLRRRAKSQFLKSQAEHAAGRKKNIKKAPHKNKPGAHKGKR